MKILIFPTWIIFKMMDMNERGLSKFVAHELEYSREPIMAISVRVWILILGIAFLSYIVLR